MCSTCTISQLHVIKMTVRRAGLLTRVIVYKVNECPGSLGGHVVPFCPIGLPRFTYLVRIMSADKMAEPAPDLQLKPSSATVGVRSEYPFVPGIPCEQVIRWIVSRILPFLTHCSH